MGGGVVAIAIRVAVVLCCCSSLSFRALPLLIALLGLRFTTFLRPLGLLLALALALRHALIALWDLVRPLARCGLAVFGHGLALAGRRPRPLQP